MRADRLDPVVHQPVRLSIMGLLWPADEVEFRLLRDETGASDSNLSQHLTVLEEAGYVIVTKRSRGRRPATWVRLTDGGRSALAAYTETLRELLPVPRD